jgi:hypothetical protein
MKLTKENAYIWREEVGGETSAQWRWVKDGKSRYIAVTFLSDQTDAILAMMTRAYEDDGSGPLLTPQSG